MQENKQNTNTEKRRIKENIKEKQRNDTKNRN